MSDLISFMEYCGFINLPNYKLTTVAEYFGIKLDAHEAMSDILATRKIVKKLESFLQSLGKI